MAEPLEQREIDALSADADRFIAELDEEAYLHFAGLKETFELAPIYERHERADEARDGARARRLGRREPQPARAVAVRVRGLPRQLRHREEAERVAELEATLTATVDGEEIPYRMLRAATDERGRPRRARAARGGAQRAHRGAPEPAPPAGGAGRPPRDRAARRAELRRPLPRLRLPARRARGRSAATPRLDRAALGGGRRPLLPRARRARPRRDRALGRRPRLARRRVGRGVPARPDAAGARGARSPTSASTCARSGTSSSTSRSARTSLRARSARRSRSPAASCS